METLIFIALAVGLYFFADRAVDFLERRAGRRFEHRSIIFMVLFLALLLAAFTAVRDIVAL